MSIAQPVARSIARPIARALTGDSSGGISGSVAVSSYVAIAGDVIALTFTDTSSDSLNNTYQWIDYLGNNVSGATTNTTNWTADANAPHRIRVTNSITTLSKVFTIGSPIEVLSSLIDDANNDLIDDLNNTLAAI